MFKPSSIFCRPFQGGNPFVDSLFVRFHVCLYNAVLSVHCSQLVTCWERADLLALVLLSISYSVLTHIRAKGKVGTNKHV